MVLYDLLTDRYESNDVINDEKYVHDIDNLQNKLKSWVNEVVAPWVPVLTSQSDVWANNNGLTPWISSPKEKYSYDVSYKSDKSPNIVFVMVDDWGYNDFGRRSTYLSWTTPTIDSLSYNGINLENYQSYQTCSPARGSFLTGKYPVRLGLWELHEPRAELPTSETTIAEELKFANYKTYLVGKIRELFVFVTRTR